MTRTKLRSAVTILGLLCSVCSRHDSTEYLNVFITEAAAMTFCTDTNGNFECDTNEILGETETDGTVVLDSPCQGYSTLLVEGVMPMTSEDACDSMVSPMTTLAMIHKRRTSMPYHAAQKDIANRLGRVTGDTSTDTALNTFAAVLYKESSKSVLRDTPNASTQDLMSRWYNLMLRYGNRYAPSQTKPKSTAASAVENAHKALSAASLPDHTELFQPTMAFGAGYDALNGMIIPDAHCLSMDELTPESNIERNTTTFEYAIADNVAELIDILSISLNFEMSLSTVEVNLEASFLRDIEERRNSLFIVLKIASEFADYSILAKTLADPKLLDMYANNYDAFRSRCGDMYLDSIATGVSYWAILEIETRNELEKLDIAAKVRGEYKPIDLEFGGAFKLTLEHLSQDYRYSIHILNRGVAGDLIPLGSVGNEQAKESVADLIADIESFLNNAKSARSEENLIDNFPLQAKFISYAELLGSTDATSTVERNSALIQAYREAYLYVDETIYQIRAVLTAPQLYDIAQGGDVALRQYEEALLTQKSALRTAALLCEAKGTALCEPIDESLYQNLESLRSELPQPKPKLSASCAELRESSTTPLQDGIYQLYAGNNRNRPYSAYCRETTGNTVETYLMLDRTSSGALDFSAASKPMYNFARSYIDISNTDDEKIKTIQSVYAMLLVSPFSDGLIVADTQAYGVVTLSECSDSKDCPDAVAYGHGYTCSRLADTQLEANGDIALSLPMIAQIDLTGTSFHLSTDVGFIEKTPIDIVRVPMTCDEAKETAAQMGGSLLIVFDEIDNQNYKNFLGENYLSETWLNLFPVPETASVSEYAWNNTWENPAFRAWRKKERTYGLGVDPESLCVTMSQDGLWDEVSAQVKRPFVVQYSKAASEVVISADRKTVDIKARERMGGCGGITPSGGLVLVYDLTSDPS